MVNVETENSLSRSMSLKTMFVKQDFITTLIWQQAFDHLLQQLLAKQRFLVEIIFNDYFYGLEWLLITLLCLFQSKSSLDQMESQSADAEPPPPPKPEMRYPGLPRADTEGETYKYKCTRYVLPSDCLLSSAAAVLEVYSLLCKQIPVCFPISNTPCSCFTFGFLAAQRAACWLKLHLHRQCTSTDQPTTAQEGTTLPSHTPTRYISIHTSTVLEVLGINY